MCVKLWKSTFEQVNSWLRGNRNSTVFWNQRWSVRNASHHFSYGSQHQLPHMIPRLVCKFLPISYSTRTHIRPVCSAARESRTDSFWLRNALWKYAFWMSFGSADYVATRTLGFPTQCSTGSLGDNDALVRLKNSFMAPASCADKCLRILEPDICLRFTSDDAQPVYNDLTAWRLNQGRFSIP